MAQDQSAEIAALKRRLRELSIVITDHLGGGSEWFSPLGDDFYADPKSIGPELQRRKTDAQITKRALFQAKARHAQPPSPTPHQTEKTEI